jgi:hypothetical protein
MWAAASGGSINFEECDSEDISAADNKAIDFNADDFDVTDDSDEANVAIAAAIARDSEVTSAIMAAVAGTTNFLAYFNGANSVVSSNVGATANTMVIPTGCIGPIGLVFGDGDSWFCEASDDNFSWYTAGAARASFNQNYFAASGPRAFSMLVVGSLSSATFPTYSFALDTNTGLFSASADTLGVTAGGVSLLEFGGGTHTARIWDQTATTGDTLVKYF